LRAEDAEGFMAGMEAGCWEGGMPEAGREEEEEGEGEVGEGEAGWKRKEMRRPVKIVG
jgi:hypothetical protein